MRSLMLLGIIEGICYESSTVLQLVGWVLTVFKIAVPLIIVVLGIIDLAKAAISSKPDEIKKSVTSLVWRLVGGIAIFFVPAIIMMLFGFIKDYTAAEEEITSWDICHDCIVSPWKDTCKNAATSKSNGVEWETYNR